MLRVTTAALLCLMLIMVSTAAMSAPAKITCAEVREYVAEHGKVKAWLFALNNGATLAEIRKAAKCLRS